MKQTPPAHPGMPCLGGPVSELTRSPFEALDLGNLVRGQYVQPDMRAALRLGSLVRTLGAAAIVTVVLSTAACGVGQTTAPTTQSGTGVVTEVA